MPTETRTVQLVCEADLAIAVRSAFALGEFVAINFSINAKFFGKHLSKINRDKCLKIWGSKMYLAIKKCPNTWTRACNTEGCRNIGKFGDFCGGEIFVVLTA